MKIYLDSIGCRLNQSEIEQYASQFRLAGHEIVARAAEADLVVVNTCAVTNEAASDSRQKVRQAHRAGAGEIVVTGCWSTLDAAGASSLPGVTRVVPNPQKDALVSDLLGEQMRMELTEPIARVPLPGLHQRTRAFIKVQDGCDNHCTFCVTRVARGPGRSRPAAEVLAEINAAVEGGSQEVVLTGVHLGSWGGDLERPQHLRALIEAILKQTDIRQLRLSSLEPWDLDESFFSLWSDPRLCPHLHLPLQSGSSSVLRRMARKTTPEQFMALVNAARAVSPDAAITTDIIAGFPGESEAEFEESLVFVRSVGFAGGHAFTYSPRPGTPAARLPNAVALPARKARNAAYRQAFAESGAEYRRKFEGQTLPVLWESCDAYGPEGWRLHGLTGNYLRVSATSPEKKWNELSRVRLLRGEGEGFYGEIVGDV